MPSDQLDQPFDTIESAIDLMNVLAQTVLEAMNGVHQDKAAAADTGEIRRAQALDLALFKLKTLNCYIFKSRRTLNDLRTIRRLLMNERQTPARALTASANG
jgi:hypothetical protein